ncbi:hypothetical protein GCM10027429_18030 [Marivirga atlantica]|jgi:membrane protease YdiL (CAAX protease family)|uniref:CPBP family intramembrane metalloprotease n=1 Tax=Marivirga atlantica TaxID=1548457 RepID=A0A937AEV4_9BACT|nr:CPBP family intramembrane metalloprotease [Marivirga atlantica]
MIGILIAVLISWLLFYLLEKKSVLALGLLPFKKRVTQFLNGFLLSALLCLLTQFLEAFLKSSSWEVADNINLHSILQSSLWDVKSVSTEELIFRGVLLYILIGKVGSRKGVMISAIAFGVYHWFSYGVIGNVMPMIFVFIGTGLMGYGWAWAFAKTKSIMLPFGLHLGWNFTYNTIFSKGPLGEMLLISHGGSELGDWASLLNFLSGLVIVPLIILAYVHLFVREKGETTSQ